MAVDDGHTQRGACAAGRAIGQRGANHAAGGIKGESTGDIQVGIASDTRRCIAENDDARHRRIGAGVRLAGQGRHRGIGIHIRLCADRQSAGCGDLRTAADIDLGRGVGIDERDLQRTQTQTVVVDFQGGSGTQADVLAEQVAIDIDVCIGIGKKFVACGWQAAVRHRHAERDVIGRQVDGSFHQDVCIRGDGQVVIKVGSARQDHAVTEKILCAASEIDGDAVTGHAGVEHLEGRQIDGDGVGNHRLDDCAASTGHIDNTVRCVESGRAHDVVEVVKQTNLQAAVIDGPQRELCGDEIAYRRDIADVGRQQHSGLDRLHRKRRPARWFLAKIRQPVRALAIQGLTNQSSEIAA